MIVIKKRVSLEFLGEEYKNSYLLFKSIPAIEFDNLLEKLNGLEDNKQDAVKVLLEILKQYFITGEFAEDGELKPVVAEDLGGLDAETLVKSFQIFTGQEIDPKVETPLTNSSATVATHPENI